MNCLPAEAPAQAGDNRSKSSSPYYGEAHTEAFRNLYFIIKLSYYHIRLLLLFKVKSKQIENNAHQPV
jgi:hypothetical protein